MMSDSVAEFATTYPFGFDPFQQRALEALLRAESVLVAAPTGSGKTVIGEFGVWLALKEGGKAFYTTPLKALSNQKFGDLVAMHGAEKVGLLTGDNSINPEAPIVVMTTEVLRNMIYERSTLLNDLRYVILDEVHYLQDRYRGAVWEEVIIHLPVDVKIVSLSATVSNAEEFADWIQTLRGPTTAIIEESRPVKLEQHYLVDSEIYPMFVSTGEELLPNPEIRRLESRSDRPRSRRGRPPGHRYTRKLARRTEVVDLLSAGQMLPAIYFIFSRKGCNAAVSQCVREGIDLVDQDERRRIADYADARCSYLAQEDLAVLGYDEWLRALKSGIAAHHAGLIPAFKETVEELFQAGLVRVVFATETLSLGINMPAKSVVIESLFKFTGERHEMLTPGEYTQLTGRAGRRGIDTLGHSVVPQQRDTTFQQIAGLASTRTYPLISSFQPSYNMATNLIRNYSRQEADHLLNSSFAQYRADKDVVVLERLIERNEGYLASYREKMHCERGDFAAYWELREQVTALEKSISRWAMTAGREQIRSVLDLARPGQVLMVTTGKMRGPVAVVGHERSRRGDPRVLAITRNGRLVRLSAVDFPRAPRVVGSLREMKGWGGLNSFSSAKSIDHETRRRLTHELERLALPDDAYDPTPLPEEEEGSGLDLTKQKLIQHPCHGCDERDKHAQWAERASRLEKENDGLIKRVRRRTETLSRRFERVLGILEEYGYVDGFHLTEKGWLLARIYNENDLLVAEALAKGWLDALKPAELAAVASTFVFESRGPIEVVGTLPTPESKKVFGKLVRSADRIKRAESRAGLEMTRGPESGFADVVYRWCHGSALEDVIDDDSTPGDFIRGCKQTVDLLKQMSQAAGSTELRRALDDAVDGVNRGVVAYTGVI